MNKTIIFSFIILVSLSILVTAIHEIERIETNDLTSGNNICEYYEKVFEIGEKDEVTINGYKLSIELIEIEQGEREYWFKPTWKINGQEGSDDFFIRNVNDALKHVKMSHSGEGNSITTQSMGFDEKIYHTVDCTDGYNKQFGFIQELTIDEGWNLIPNWESFGECYYSGKNEVCKDDVLAEYYYIPELNKYLSAEEIEDNEEIFRKYIDDDTNPASRFYSRWVYLDSSASDKWLTYQSSVNNKREEYLKGGHINLFKNWNFLTFQPFMVWNDNLEDDRLTFSEMTGTCNIIDLYFWEPRNKEWIKWDLNEEVDDDLIGAGFVIKVSDDCNLGYKTGEGQDPPILP